MSCRIVDQGGGDAAVVQQAAAGFDPLAGVPPRPGNAVLGIIIQNYGFGPALRELSQLLSAPSYTLGDRCTKDAHAGSPGKNP